MTDRADTVPLSQPDITQVEIDAVVGVLSTPNLSLGPKRLDFDTRFAEYAADDRYLILSGHRERGFGGKAQIDRVTSTLEELL